MRLVYLDESAVASGVLPVIVIVECGSKNTIEQTSDVTGRISILGCGNQIKALSMP
jgi:hypothetical protein